MMNLMTWHSLPFALANASADWSASSGLQELQKALGNEAAKRSAELLEGIQRYIAAPYQRHVPEPRSIWKSGSARLLDYGDDGTPLLFIPSLINRYYILDLEENRSLLRYLSQQGIRPFVLDWGVPDSSESDFGTLDYVNERILPAIDFLHRSTGQQIALAGYCMGGVLSIAAAQLAPKKLSSLSLFATPWDFHCKSFAPFILSEEWQGIVSQALSGNKPLPGEWVQSLFYMTDPWVFEQKFRRFAGLDLASSAARDFIALERWVNDGVPMTARVARDTLLGWAQKNSLATGGWRLSNKIIDPQKIKLPTFIAIPKNDHVVPFDCAWPLVQLFKNATILQPSSGHVGMMVGRSARKELWEPFASWLAALHK
jgi:polyhydroxyalkanoate synthase